MMRELRDTKAAAFRVAKAGGSGDAHGVSVPPRMIARAVAEVSTARCRHAMERRGRHRIAPGKSAENDRSGGPT
jgi:hypothetical protein